MKIEQEVQMVSELLKLIANPHRLLLLCILMDGEQPVNELLCRMSDISQSAVSQHLAILRTYGLIAGRKQGQQVFYSIADHRIDAVMQLLKSLYCTSDSNNQKGWLYKCIL